MTKFSGDAALFKCERAEDEVTIFAVRPADLTYHVPEPIGKQRSAWRINPSVLKRSDGNLLRALRVPLSNELGVNKQQIKMPFQDTDEVFWQLPILQPGRSNS
jgi:hypothetical protein